MNKIEPLIVYPTKQPAFLCCYRADPEINVVKIAEKAINIAEEAKESADKALNMKLTSDYTVDIESAELYIQK